MEENSQRSKHLEEIWNKYQELQVLIAVGSIEIVCSNSGQPAVCKVLNQALPPFRRNEDHFYRETH